MSLTRHQEQKNFYEWQRYLEGYQGQRKRISTILLRRLYVRPRPHSRWISQERISCVGTIVINPHFSILMAQRFYQPPQAPPNVYPSTQPPPSNTMMMNGYAPQPAAPVRPPPGPGPTMSQPAMQYQPTMVSPPPPSKSCYDETGN